MYKQLLLLSLFIVSDGFVQAKNSIKKEDAKTEETGSQVFTRLSKVLKYGIPARLILMNLVDIGKQVERCGGWQKLINDNYRCNEIAYELLFTYCVCQGYYLLADQIKHADKGVDYCVSKVKELLEGSDEGVCVEG